MPFSTTGSIVSTDLDNMLRGLYRDNSDHAITGTLVETNLSSVSVAANTIGPTGCLFLLAVGSSIGAGAGKTVKLYLGANLLIALTVPAGNQCWFIKMWMYNTSTSAQRIYVESGTIPAVVGVGAAPVLTYYYFLGNSDTTANQTLKTTATLGNVGDTCTNSMFDLYVAQIT